MTSELLLRLSGFIGGEVDAVVEGRQDRYNAPRCKLTLQNAVTAYLVTATLVTVTLVTATLVTVTQ